MKGERNKPEDLHDVLVRPVERDDDLVEAQHPHRLKPLNELEGDVAGDVDERVGAQSQVLLVVILRTETDGLSKYSGHDKNWPFTERLLV